MPVKVISVGGGYVSSKDPSMLSEGELSCADDSFYKPNNQSLWKIPGRNTYSNTAEDGTFDGVTYLEFDGVQQDVFVGLVGNKFRIGDANTSGSFSDLRTGLESSPTMDTVHYNNDHFLLTGTNRNYSVTTTNSSGTTVTPPTSSSSYFQGMVANTTAPTVAGTGGSGAFSLTSGSTITYWVEERYKEGDVIIKRSIASSDTTVTLTGTGVSVSPVITFASLDNSDATHRALYATATNGSFPTGAEIAEVVVATTTQDDTRTTTDPPIPSGSTYELWVANIFGATITTPRHGPPTDATTGDVFEDSICINDVLNPSHLRFSFADDPHAFPANNLIRFETKKHDEITLIRRMGDVLMVSLRDSLWRVNILPRPEDAAFDITRVKDQIEGAFGCVGPNAGTTFSFGQGMRLAYVSTSGIVVANEASWDVLTDDLDWENEVELSLLSQSILIDNPKMYRLEFYYTPTGGSLNSKAFFLHYHPSHNKGSGGGGGFRAKVAGPNNVLCNAAMVAFLDGDRIVFTASDAKLWVEGASNNDESDSQGIKFVCRTGDIYLHGVGGESVARRLWVHHSAGASGQTGTAKIIMVNSIVGETTKTDDAVDLSRREPTEIDATGQGEALKFSMENNDDFGTFSVNYFAIDTDSGGETEQ